jgi:hypothetical protein
MFSASNIPHFHGQTLRDTRAEIGRQGSIRVPGQEAKTAPFGAPSFFVISISLAREIWRPAVSGTGGIQDDRIAGRQKLKPNGLRVMKRSPVCVEGSWPRTREHGVTETQIYAGKRHLLTQKVTA